MLFGRTEATIAVQSSDADIVQIPPSSEEAFAFLNAAATRQFVVTTPAVPLLAPIGLL